jgi:spore maturation protein CgeB
MRSFYAQGLEKVYDIGNELEIFTSTEELIKKIKYYSENIAARQQIANKGYLRTISLHDSKIRLQNIIDFIDFEKYSIHK